MDASSNAAEVRRTLATEWALLTEAAGKSAADRVHLACVCDLRGVLEKWLPVAELGESGAALLGQRLDTWVAILGPAGVVDRSLRFVNSMRLQQAVDMADAVRSVEASPAFAFDGRDLLADIDAEREGSRLRAMIVQHFLAQFDLALADGLAFHANATPVLGLEDGMYMQDLGAVPRYFYRSLTSGEVLNQLRGYVVAELGRITAHSPPCV